MPYHHIAASNLDLFYSLYGNGDKKILFIMGLVTDGGAWGMQTDYFSLHHPSYQCLTYDHRGIGKSSVGNAWRHTTSMMAGDALSLVNHLGWEQFHVVGVSMGGMISIELACAHPNRILSLSLIATHAGGFPMAIAPIDGTLTLFKSILAPTTDEKINHALTLLYGKKTLADDDKKKLLTLHHIERFKKREKPQIAGILAQLLAIPSHYVSYSRLLRIRYSPFPTLVLVGTEDALVREENSRLIARTICATKFVIVEGAAHGVLAEDAQVVNQELLAMFEKGDELKNLSNSDQNKYKHHLKVLDKCCKHQPSCFLQIAGNTIKGALTGAVVGFVAKLLIGRTSYVPADVGTWSLTWKWMFVLAVLRCGYTSFTCLRRSIIAYYAFKKLSKCHARSTSPASVLDSREHISSEHYWFPISPVFYLLAATVAAWKWRTQVLA